MFVDHAVCSEEDLLPMGRRTGGRSVAERLIDEASPLTALGEDDFAGADVRVPMPLIDRGQPLVLRERGGNGLRNSARRCGES